MRLKTKKGKMTRMVMEKRMKMTKVRTTKKKL